MTGLSPEQILAIGGQEQNQQQVANQSSAAFTDALYKQALQQYYQTQGENQARKITLDAQSELLKNSLTAERNKYQNLGDLAAVMKIQQEIDMLNAGTHPSQTGTQAAMISAGAAAQNAQTNALSQQDLAAYRNSELVLKELDNQISAANAATSRMNAETSARGENRQTAQYLLDEEKFAFNRSLDNAKLALDEIRTRARAMEVANQTERDQGLAAKRQAEIDQIRTKLRGTVADTVAAIEESKKNEIAAKGYIDFYNDIADDETTDLYLYSTKGLDKARAISLKNSDTGKLITLGEIRMWAQEENKSVDELIREMYGEE